jgi:ribosomal protein L16 Arg81 hydroxylase
MAKKQATKAKPPEPEPGPRRTVLTIKGTEAWSQWLNRLADHVRLPASTMVDHALIRYAKEMGFSEEAPKR